MYELKKKIGKVFTNKFVGAGPSSYEKIINGATVSQRLRNTDLESIVCFLLGNSPVSEFYMPTFWNTLSVPSS